MRALVWEAPELMRLKEAATPDPSPGWVVMRVGAVGICGSELGGYLGHNELRVPPLIMGHEWAGEVSAVRSREDEALLGQVAAANPLVSCGRCRACLRGDRQLCPERRIIGIDFPGAFADMVAVPARALYPVPDSVMGALVEPLACAVRAVRQAGVRPGDQVLVYGAGVIGLFSAWMAGRAGAAGVYVLDTNAVRLGQAERFGADLVLLPGRDDIEAELRRAAPAGMDAVIDAVGAAGTREGAVGALRRGGRAVFIGLHEAGAPLPGNRMVRDEITVRGSFCYTDDDFRIAAGLVGGSALPEGGEWLDIRPLEEGQAAFQEQARGPAPFAKILLRVS